jgi:hypothetical protein
MSMDDFMRSLSDQQKAMFLAALQDSGTPPNEEDIDINPKWTTTMPPHIKKEFENEDTTTSVSDFTMKSKSAVQSQKRKERVTAGKNTWSDSGESKDVQTPSIAMTPRTRPPAKMVDMNCHVCGKTFSINSSLVYGQFYRCDGCSGR